MKKSTFLLFVLMIALVTTGQKSVNLQLKIEKMQEKYSYVSEHSKFFQNRQTDHFSLPGLKSAAATVKLDSTVSRVLDLDAEIWQNDFKEAFFYDSQMRSILWKDFEWNNDDKTWEVYGETELEYNEQGYISSMTFSEIDEFSGEMIPDNKIEATYNEEGKIAVLNNFSYEEGNWVHEAEQEYHYNASGKLIQVDLRTIDEDEEMLMKYVNTYNASGQIESQSMYFVDGEDELLFYQTDYTYDANGRLIESIDWGLSFISFMLEKQAQSVYEYNAAGDVSVEIYSEWDGNKWVHDYKDEFSYNNTNFSEIAFPSFIPMFHMGEGTSQSFNKVITMVKTSIMIEGSWVHSETTTFHYSDDPSLNIQNKEGILISVYPNPVTETVTLRWENSYEPLELEIYQISGSRVKAVQAISGEPVSLAGLQSGVYLFKLKNNSETLHTGKLIKK